MTRPAPARATPTLLARAQYRDVCSAYRLLMHEISLNHDRRYKGWKDAEKRLKGQPEWLLKAAQDAWNWHQNWQLHNTYAPVTMVYALARLHRAMIAEIKKSHHRNVVDGER